MTVIYKETTRQLRNTISYMDGEEAFYHGFMLGLLMNLSNYVKKSNREAGDGRYDKCVYNHDETIPPVILEFNVVRKYTELDAGCDEALAQADSREFFRKFAEDRYTDVICYGIAFFRTRVRMKMVRRKLPS